MTDNPYNVEWLPMTRNGKVIGEVYRPKNYTSPIALDATPSKECDEYHKNAQIQVNLSPLSKGKYDIDYAINLLKTVENKCEVGKMQPKDTLFTLRESVRRLLAMLEVEKGQQS